MELITILPQGDGMRFTLTDIDNNNNTNKLMRRLRVLQKAASRGRRLSPTYCMTDWLAFHMEDAASGSFFRELSSRVRIAEECSAAHHFRASLPLSLFLFLSGLSSFETLFFPGSLFSPLHTTASSPTYQVTVSYLPTRSHAELPTG